MDQREFYVGEFQNGFSGEYALPLYDKSCILKWKLEKRKKLPKQAAPKPKRNPSTETMKTFAFGSCNQQFTENKMFDLIAKKDPSVFLWTGDAVYATDKSTETLQDHFTYTNYFQKGYTALRKKMTVEGIWDDP